MTGTNTHPFETGLDRSSANYVPLTPVSFLSRAASAFANKTAVIDGERRYTYAELHERYLAANDKLLEWQLRAEAAERRLITQKQVVTRKKESR